MSRAAPAFSGLEWMIAGRYLRARRREGAISVIAGFSLLGILLGVATLIVVMSVMNGFRAELVDRILGAQPHISVLAYDREGLEDYEALAGRIAALEGVTRASPTIERQLMASSPVGNTGALVRALSPDAIRRLPAIADPEWSAGSLDGFGPGVAIGEGLARNLGLRVGDRVTLISPDGIDTPFGRKPRILAYEVAYVFRIGMHQYDSAFVFMELSEAQKYFRMPDRVGAIEVMVERPDAVEEIGARIREAVGDRAYLWNWQRANGSFLEALAIERTVMFIILTLIILVAALNIISGLIMLVKEKGRDVGILRTMGLGRRAILRIFFICGASIGVVGTLLGVGLGVLIAAYIADIQVFLERTFGVTLWPPSVRQLSGVPSVVHASDVLFTVGIALALSFLATLYPAWRAARLDPVEALRHE